jgi:hypothetical protein
LEQQKIFGTANWNAWKKANMSINENDDTIRRLLLNDVNDFEHLQLSLDVIDRVSVQECAAALRQNTSAEHFVLHDGIGTTAKMDKSDWVPFWNAISNHSAVHDITLAFAGTRSDSFLAAIAESASIKDVTLYKVVVNAMSLGAFFRTNTSVTHLKLTELRFRGTLYSETAAHVAASMAENTAIEVLEWQTLRPFHLPVVALALPKMKHLRKLTLSSRQQEDTADSGPSLLLQALKRNSSLLQFDTHHRDDWSEADTAKIVFYAERNEQIRAILESPTSIVPLRTAWPRVFRAVRGCLMDATVIFAALKALGDDCGGRLLDRAEKRKWSEVPHNEDEDGSGNETGAAGVVDEFNRTQLLT